MCLMSHIKEPEVGGGTHLLSNQDQQIRGLSVESANHSQSHSRSRKGGGSHFIDQGSVEALLHNFRR